MTLGRLADKINKIRMKHFAGDDEVRFLSEEGEEFEILDVEWDSELGLTRITGQLYEEDEEG